MTAYLVPDCGGLIEKIAITLPQRLLQPPHQPKAAALGKLAAALPMNVTLLLLTDDPRAVAFEAWYRDLTLSCKVELMGTGRGAPILESEMWTQDPWMIAARDGNIVLHHPARTDRPGRQASWLSASCGFEYGRPPIHLAGGNTLTGDTFRLIGTQSLDLTQQGGPTPVGVKEALNLHATLDPRPIHVFGFALPSRGEAPVELRQQPHHIDLVASLTGLVTAQGKPLVLVADPRKTLEPDGPRMEGWADQLDASVVRLEQDGFAVMRNKVPYVAHADYAPNPMLRAYNNVMLENDIRSDLSKTKPLVWLPHFGDLEAELMPYDDENRQIWEGLGFEVVPVYGWSALVRAGGAIRCVSKVLKRQPALCEG